MFDLNAALMSPGMAMAGQAIDNLGRLRQGQATVSPIQAYQQAVQQQALQKQREQQLAIQRRQAEQRGQLLDLELKKAGQPRVQKVGDSLYQETPDGWKPVVEDSGNQWLEGTGLQTQFYNIVSDPNIPWSDPNKQAAAANLSMPKTIQTPSGPMTVPGQDLSMFGYNPTGQTPEDSVFGVVDKPLTEAQTKSRTFLRSSADAHETMQALEDSNFKMRPEAIELFMRDPTASKVAFQRYATDDERLYMNAMQTFLTAKLRKESGAAIGTEEWMSGYREFLPVVGEDQKLTDQKRKNRRNVVTGFYEGSGRWADDESTQWNERFGRWDEGFVPVEVPDAADNTTDDDPDTW